MTLAMGRQGGAGLQGGVRVIGSGQHPVDADALAHLEEIARTDGLLAAPPVVLPDFHHKASQEMPSSVAVATTEQLVPHFTASSVNCGMALLATGLTADEITTPLLDRFVSAVKSRAPHPMPRRPVLSREEALRAACEGAAFAVDRYGLDTSELLAIEHGGQLELEEGTDPRTLSRFAPRFTAEASRFRFGGIGPGNHFVEVQVCTEVVDPLAASALGVREGMVVVEYHGGGGVWAGEMGRLFVPRRKSSLRRRLRTGVLKAGMHFSGSPSVAAERFRLYFTNVRHAIPLDSAEGRRLWMSYCTAMNYGFAYRIASYQVIRQALADAWGAPVDTKLVYDSPHNSIYREDVGGVPALVHRHNAARVVGPGTLSHPVFGSLGQPALLPGTNRTSSWLCLGDEGTSVSLNSACHGAGTLVDHAIRQGAAHPLSSVTRRYRYSSSDVELVSHVSDVGVTQALDILGGEKVLRPVARFTPVAGLT